ncbi:MAG: plastocyanin/azurin family copper-binding protein [Gemmatimonadaceae bacterium]
MRFNGIALFAGAMLVAACGGGESKSADSAAAVPETPAVVPAAPPTGTVAAAPITGKTHTVNMVGDEKGYRYEPATLTVAAGDGIDFIMVSGGPHNVSFDAATVPDDVKPQLLANMPNSADLASPMMMNANEKWTLSLGSVKPGKYVIICTPHLAMGMKMDLTVQ